tara:strand:+ start:1417 stop:2352 length:936 start_codon:yes stop_codon:yes gene_type:complete
MKISRFFDSLSIKAGVLAMLALGGCIATTYPYMRTETAQRIAAPAWMIKRDISADPFILRAYERIHDRGGYANIYIEGESTAAGSATPFNPVALHLASKDDAENVIYIARPCQYTGMLTVTADCSTDYNAASSFSDGVIDSYNIALDDIANRYNIHTFNLIGYSGGAAIASLLASQRKDVVSLRTVAGILDHDAYTTLSGIPPFSESRNPVNEASTLTKMPQYHFIGGRDGVVPPTVLHSFLQSMPPTNCVQTMLIQEAEHDVGWVDKWPELLELSVNCNNSDTAFAPETLMPPTMPQDLPRTVREKPVKP